MRLPPLVNATLAWSTLGLQWMEMLAASSQTIAHRTRRRNTPAQLFEMGGEKALAMMESSSAMTRQMMRFPTSSALTVWNAWARMLSGGLAPYRVRARRNARAARRRPAR